MILFMQKIEAKWLKIEIASVYQIACRNIVCFWMPLPRNIDATNMKDIIGWEKWYEVTKDGKGGAQSIKKMKASDERWRGLCVNENNEYEGYIMGNFKYWLMQALIRSQYGRLCEG